MLVKLAVRNCWQNKARSLFTILTVAAALLINGLFVSYQLRVQAMTAHRPAQNQVLVATATSLSGPLFNIPSIVRTEKIALIDAFVASEPVKVLSCSPTSRLVNPFLSAGAFPRSGECLVPQRIARLTALDVGSIVQLFIPSLEQSLSLQVSGISNDELWPYVIVPADSPGLLSVPSADERVLLEIEAATSPTAAIREIRQRVQGAAIVRLDDLPGALGMTARQTPSAAQALQSRLAAMILLVAAIGVANNLALSLVERNTQIALLEALGVPRVQASALYIVEAIAMLLVGGGLAALMAAVLTALKGPLLGEKLVIYVLKGLPWIVGLGLLGCVIVLFMWRFDPPLTVLRKRPL